ncbi:MAG: hypothetical protein NW220_02915 [Leptolyngbyaceae cyanobacterium bins.349]|nr:hypothetical protein [Leptolyngbyaceae cyanobacterium bins.349]
MEGILAPRRSRRPPHRNPPCGAWALILGWLMLTGCNSRAISEPAQVVAPVPTTAIANLPPTPTQPTTVYVKGTVGDRVPLLEGTVYQLQDATGTVWILTQQPPPQAGTEIVVKGTVRYQPIVINGQQQGSIYLEQE